MRYRISNTGCGCNYDDQRYSHDMLAYCLELYVLRGKGQREPGPDRYHGYGGIFHIKPARAIRFKIREYYADEGAVSLGTRRTTWHLPFINLCMAAPGSQRIHSNRLKA